MLCAHCQKGTARHDYSLPSWSGRRVYRLCELCWAILRVRGELPRKPMREEGPRLADFSPGSGNRWVGEWGQGRLPEPPETPTGFWPSGMVLP